MTQLDAPTVYALARNAGLAHDRAVTATSYAQVESSFETTAGLDHLDSNGRYSIGLWQINLTDGPAPGTGGAGFTKDQLVDPANNAKAMAQRSGVGENWRPWLGSSAKAALAYPGVKSQIEAARRDNPNDDSLASKVVDIGKNVVIAGPLGAAVGKALDVSPLDALHELGGLLALATKATLWAHDPRNTLRVVMILGGAVTVGIGLIRMLEAAGVPVPSSKELVEKIGSSASSKTPAPVAA